MKAPETENIHNAIRRAASEAVQQKLEVHRRLGQQIAVQKPGHALVVDSVENVLSENEQNPPHVA